ncbi:hypothetical protein ACH5RR_018662 [Cinchona calisaya]|uniref:Uncharacterized protein n=1 Tax=Cinchona calisaya TaxID=153742 RepID=A0ABD2ZMK3_9GENT
MLVMVRRVDGLIDYEEIIEYCCHYRKIGHEEAYCFFKNPLLKNPSSTSNLANSNLEVADRVYGDPKFKSSDNGKSGPKKDPPGGQKIIQWVPKKDAVNSKPNLVINENPSSSGLGRAEKSFIPSYVPI